MIKADEDEDTQHDPHVWLDPVLNKNLLKKSKMNLLPKIVSINNIMKITTKLIKDIDHIDQQMKDISKIKTRQSHYLT